MRKWFFLSIGQKYLIGLTGLGLALFVLLHMLGNLLIFAGDKAYNLYMHQMVNSKAAFIIQVGLLTSFLLHIILTLCLSVKNYLSRPKKYARPASGWKATAWYQKSLIFQGAIILVFVILHLITFKYGTYYEVTYEGKTIRNLYLLVEEVFQNPITVIWYLLALLILSLHLFHGLGSSFQSLGLSHPRFEGGIKHISAIYATLVTAGYISLPLYVFFFMAEKGG
ncbi:MAG: succinate dehydrogenase cytochrome b subunit [Oligoflexia bacterium]|nr:succinate dehydrogenase cytochrome b subunit [Bdellovibrionales bacterium]MYE07611.1 succinate dehydrogenase cytochrome b subunit [Oligoflexia bacterium]